MLDTTPDNPPHTGLVGMILFLAALAMLFISGLLGYVLIRTTGRFAPPRGTLQIPALLWGSTVVILISSVTVQHALVCVRREKKSHFRLSLSATLALALLFIALQIPALRELLAQHEQFRARNINIYGMIIFLIALHAAHVLGGLIPLLLIWTQALRGRYDHEQHAPVRYLSLYWHFLDIVWVVMFATFLVLD